MATSWKPLAERLASKYRENEVTGCWEWTAYINRHGYGTIEDNYKPKPAHRASFELHCGEIPKGMHVLHVCDNRKCVNPKHLFLGTHADNMADMIAKGREQRGAAHKRPNAKLTEMDVLAIKAARGISQKALGAQYGVGQDQISRIRSGKRWSYL
jgi:HNH endonuclease